jgi:hypothetical protein
MPYKMKRTDGDFSVINAQTGDVKAKLTTKAKAKRQIRLLESIEKPTKNVSPIDYQEERPKVMGGAAIGPGANPINIRMSHNVVSTTGGMGMLPKGTSLTPSIMHPRYPYLPSMDQSYSWKTL